VTAGRKATSVTSYYYAGVVATRSSHVDNHNQTDTVATDLHGQASNTLVAPMFDADASRALIWRLLAAYRQTV